MKKSFRLLVAAVSIVGLASCQPSLDDDDIKVPVEEEPGDGDDKPGDNGGNDNPGDNGGDEPGQTIKIIDAFDLYYVDFFKDSTDPSDVVNHSLYLVSEGLTEGENSYEGTGSIVVVDLNTPEGVTDLAEGKYTMATSYSSEAFVLNPGEPDGEGDYYPTVIQFVKNGDLESVAVCVGGQMTVSKSGDNYKIALTLTTEDNKTYSYAYNGTIDFEAGNEGGGDFTDYSLEGYKYGYVVYYGLDAWNAGTSYNDYELYLAKEAFTDFEAADYICLDILTDPSSVAGIPAGTYESLDDLNDDAQFLPGSVVPGFTDTDYSCLASWLFEGDLYIPVVEGTVDVISASDGVYTLDIELLAGDESGVYLLYAESLTTEKLTFLDKSTSVTAAYTKAKLQKRPGYGVRKAVAARKSFPLVRKNSRR